MRIDMLNINWIFLEATVSNSYVMETSVMFALPMYHIYLICTAIGSLVREGLPHQGANEAYVRLLPEATYVSQNGLFALLICSIFRL